MNFANESRTPGWVTVTQTRPERKDRVVGIPSLGLAQISLTNDVLIEDMVYVERTVAGSTGDIPRGGAQGDAGGEWGGGSAKDAQGGSPAAGQSKSRPLIGPTDTEIKLFGPGGYRP
jgi:hypothetical protein